MTETAKIVCAAICLGMFVLTTVSAYIEVQVKLKDDIAISPIYWIVPGIWAAAFYIFSH